MNSFIINDRINVLKDRLCALEENHERLLTEQQNHIVDGLDGKEETFMYRLLGSQVEFFEEEIYNTVQELKTLERGGE